MNQFVKGQLRKRRRRIGNILRIPIEHFKGQLGLDRMSLQD